MNYKYSELTREIIGAAMEVHNILGNGFQEVIYQRAFDIELGEKKNLNVAREFEMTINYKNKVIGTRRVDFLINNLIAIKSFDSFRKLTSCPGA